MSEVSSDVPTIESSVPKPKSCQTGSENVFFKIPIGPMQLRPSSSQFKVNTQTAKKEGMPDENMTVSASLKSSQRNTSDEVVPSISPATSDVPYTEPSWSALPPTNSSYSFEILKGGVIVGTFDLGVRPYVVFGRHLSCDLVMEHPSISRYHSVIQYRRNSGSVVPTDEDHACEPEISDGFYVYDLGSTHGTFLNKNQLKPHRYYRLFVGHMLRFGGSSRTYLMQGPDEECEAESEFTVTEIQAMAKLAKERTLLDAARKKQKEEENKQEDEGIDWGMGEDAVDEDDHDNGNEDGEEVISGVNPFALNPAAPNEDSYIDDPKKALRTWFEREGFELEYNIEEKGQAHFSCSIRLPLDHSTSGEPLVVEASVKGKKKEAVVACALEACRQLDRQGVLRQSQKKALPRLKKRDWAEDDYYDSDEDTFLDRTGTIEKKRQLRMNNAFDMSGQSKKDIETYETLLTKYAEINEKLLGIDEAFHKDSSKSNKGTGQGDDDTDDLDAYMKTLTGDGASTLDKTEKSRMKLMRKSLHQEAERLLRLIKIARPTSLPSLATARSPTVPQIKTTANIHFPELDMNITQSKDPLKVAREKIIVESSESKEESSVHATATDSCQKEMTSPEVDNEIQKQFITTEPSEIILKEKLETESKDEDKDKSLEPTDTEKAADAVIGSSKKRRQKAARKSKEARYDYDKTDPNYAMWIPPDDQMGDGKTILNEKYGY